MSVLLFILVDKLYLPYFLQLDLSDIIKRKKKQYKERN